MEIENMNPITDGQESVVDSQGGANTGESALYSDSGDAGREFDSHKFNSAMKSARLQGQRDAEKAFAGDFAKAGLINPETGKAFENYGEFKAYGAKQAAQKVKDDAAAAGKSVEEYQEDLADKDYVRSLRREHEESEASRRAEAKVKEFATADAKDFKKRYPDIDPGQLEANERFRKFAKGRLYNEPLADIYEDYMEFSSESERAALARRESKESRGTGSGSGAKDVTLTAAEQRQLDEWNERYPGMKMTAKEFKGR